MQTTLIKTDPPPVQVLLSTFNGQCYLSEQLDSLLAQDYPQVEILVRDDGSADGTWNILQTYEAEHPSIRVYRGQHLGAAKSFYDLIEKASPHAQFLAFSDQDDVWQPGKITAALNLLAAHSDKPCLYCSGVTITDAALQPLRQSNTPRRPLAFSNALVETLVFGCTAVINRQARMLLLREFPQSPLMHDAWIYLVISAFGKVIYDTKPTLLHRRHGGNSSTCPMNWRDRCKVQFHRLRHSGRHKSMLRQAEEFQRIFGVTLQGESARVLANFLNNRHSVLSRLRYALRGEIYRQSVLGNLMLKCLYVLDRVHS